MSLSYEAVEANDWAGLEQLERRLSAHRNQWIFRGHTADAWTLKTSLERALLPRRLYQQTASRLEGGLLRRFKRQAHHHLSDVPDSDSWLEWLALMQHHGAPTRLLD